MRRAQDDSKIADVLERSARREQFHRQHEVHGAASFGSILGPDASRVILGSQNRRLAASVLSIKALGARWDTPMLPDDYMLAFAGSAD